MPEDRHPLDHLRRRLFREGHEQDLVGGHHARLDRVRGPMADHPRLAGPGAGDDRQRPAREHDRLLLGGVQRGEEALGVAWLGPPQSLVAAAAWPVTSPLAAWVVLPWQADASSPLL